MKNFNTYHYYKLYTEYGPLYYFSKPLKEGEVYPEIKEFFTKDKGVYEYNKIIFNDGKSSFETRHIDLEGNIKETYEKELSAYDFLMQVAPYLKNKDIKKSKQEAIKEMFNRKANNMPNDRILTGEETISEEQKNSFAAKILSLYL